MDLLTVKQVAERLQVTPYTVRKWLRARKLHGIIISDSTGWRVEEAELRRFIEQHRAQDGQHDAAE